MQKTCIKCGHVNQNASGADTDACPACGAIYAKAQRTLARPAPAAAIEPQSSLPIRTPVRQREPFIDRLRAESLYPTFRKVVTIFHVLGQVMAVLVLLGGLIATYNTGSAGAAIGATVGAIFMSIFFRVAKEASLMLADMSDATVRMAERGDS
jgi:hypothetical protein